MALARQWRARNGLVPAPKLAAVAAQAQSR